MCDCYRLRFVGFIYPLPFLVLGLSPAILRAESTYKPSNLEVYRFLKYLAEAESITKEVARDPTILPRLEKIITDPKSHPVEIAWAMTALRRYTGNRSRYREIAVQKLAHSDSGVRLYAVRLVGEIGNERDTPPLVALLSDEDHMVSYMAAKAIAKIGGRRDVLALDAWLQGSAHKEAIGLRKDVKECRDLLQKRLDEEEKNRRSTRGSP